MSEEIYPPQERLIYSYFDGTKVVAADPMILYKRFMEVLGDLQGDVAVMNSPSKACWQAHTKCAEKAYKVLAALPLGEGGLTQQEAIDELFRFWNWCEAVKKNSRTPATSPDATPDSSASSSGGSPTT